MMVPNIGRVGVWAMDLRFGDTSAIDAAAAELDELSRKISLLRAATRGTKAQVKWHDPRATFAEGISSRGDRRIGHEIGRGNPHPALRAAHQREQRDAAIAGRELVAVVERDVGHGRFRERG